MSLLQMSLSGAVMIVVVIVIRAIAINRLPKRTFLILWGIVLLRLLVPFSIPSTFRVYSLIEQNITSDMAVQIPTAQSSLAEHHGSVEADDPDAAYMVQNGNTGGRDTGEIAAWMQGVDKKIKTIFAESDNKDNENDNGVNNDEGGQVISDKEYFADKRNDIGVILMYALQKVLLCYQQIKSLCFMIWCAGMMCCIGYFAISYLHCRFEFRISLPVENAFVQRWVQQNLRCRETFILPRRLISIRQSDRISSPLTYGIVHPVILMPKSTDWDNTEQLQYVLMHEYVHICRYDALMKLIVTCTLCIHWLNPLVWIMWFLFNRDVEIACDECVVRHMGEASKSAYALMLIQMEAKRSGFAPLCSGLLSRFGNKAMKERITAIMKIRKKSMLAVVVAAVLVISVTIVMLTTAFAASAAETKNNNKEYEMLLALKFDGYEDMSISEYRNKVWALTDTEEYRDLIERFFQDETIYAMYETAKGTDSNETADFLYNVLGPVMSGRQSVSFNGYAVTDFDSASENASLEYSGTLTILDADQLTVGEYLSVRHHIEEDMGSSLHGLSVSELRDEELMKVLLDETVLNITMMYQNNLMKTDLEYVYKPLDGVAADDMDDWQKERRDEWDKMMEPYVPFGLTYNYDWDTDDYKMFFNGKEVRGIYDGEENIWISEHVGIGKDIYAPDAIELFVVYENHKIVGLREATAQEMEEITARRQAATDAYQSGEQEIRETMPAAKEDYRSLFTLKTSDYRQKSIADFNMEYLDWCNEDYERMERIGCDRGWSDYRVALTDEERSFVELTTWLSGMENAEYVRSLNKNKPEQDISDRVCLTSKEEYAQNGYGSAWCALDYGFSYHISDKEKVSIGERDDQVGGMVREIQDYWDSADINEILQLAKSDLLKQLQSIAAKYSNQNIAITILDDQTYFESMDERMLYD